MSRRIIKIGSQSYSLIVDDFEEDMDIDNLLKIDYANLIGEMITFPVVVNRFGQMLAEAESQVAESKLNLEIFEAKTKEKLRLELAEMNGGKNPTVDTLNNAVVSNKAYQAFRKRLIEAQKTRDYVNSVFWSCKDKSDKLNKLSLSVQNVDLEDSIIEGRVNNIMVKKTKKLID